MGDDRKRLRQALAGYKQLLAAEPEHLGHLEQLARLSLALGQPGRAAGFLVSRAEVLARRGEVEVALADCRSALAVDPGHREAERLCATLERLVMATPVETPNPSEILAFRTPRPEVPAEVRARSTLPLSPVKRPIQHLIDELPLDEPIIEASALLAVRDVDGFEVVSLPTDHPTAIVGRNEDETLDEPVVRGGMRPVDRTTDRREPSARPAVMPEQIVAHRSPEDSLEIELDQVEAMLRLTSSGPEPNDLRASVDPLPEAELFEPLPQATRDDVARLVTRHRFLAGGVLVRPGDLVTELLVLSAGRVRLERADGEGESLLLLTPGDLLGELERVHGGPARFRAVAETAVEVVGLEAMLVDSLRRRFPGFDSILRREATRRHGAWLLAANPMFRALGPAERAFVSGHFQAKRLRSGALLCDAGDHIDFLALVAGGELDVTRDDRPVATLKAGRFAGLAALAHAGRASARITAGDRGALIYLLERPALDDLRRLPAIRDLLDAAVAQRA
jgi:CRP-like cAMP-binding protein